MKRFLSAMLAALLLFSLCGVSASANATEEITILYPGEETEEMSNFLHGPFAEKMAKELQLKVNITFLSWDNYWDQKKIMLAAKTPIDLYWDGLPDLASLVNNKEAQPLDELIAKCWPESMKQIIPETQLSGGRINNIQYGIPSSYAPSSAMYQFVCLRKDLLDAMGMEGVSTAEDLHEFAKRTTSQYPHMKGPADVIFKPLTRYFADEQYFWVASQDLCVFGEESLKAYSYASTQAFEKVARFNREMYLEGLYSDDLTIKYNERDSRMQTGLYLWVEGSFGKEHEIGGTVKTSDPNAVLQNYLLKPDAPKYINATGGEVLCIPYSAKNPEGAMRFLSWLWGSEDNYLFCLYGVRGQDFQINENGRLVTLSDTAGSDGYFYEWMFRNMNYQLFKQDVSDEYISKYKSWDEDAKLSAMLGFAFNNEGLEPIETACNEIYNKELAPILYGFVDFDSNYPAAINHLKSAGIDQYLEALNAQLTAFIAGKNK